MRGSSHSSASAFAKPRLWRQPPPNERSRWSVAEPSHVPKRRERRAELLAESFQWSRHPHIEFFHPYELRRRLRQNNTRRRSQPTVGPPYIRTHWVRRLLHSPRLKR